MVSTWSCLSETHCYKELLIFLSFFKTVLGKSRKLFAMMNDRSLDFEKIMRKKWVWSFHQRKCSSTMAGLENLSNSPASLGTEIPLLETTSTMTLQWVNDSSLPLGVFLTYRDHRINSTFSFSIIWPAIILASQWRYIYQRERY